MRVWLDEEYRRRRLSRILTGNGDQLCGERWRLDQDRRCLMGEWEGYRLSGPCRETMWV